MFAIKDIPWDGKRLIKAAILPLVMFYLAFHAVSGERGMVAWFKESRRLDSLQAELSSVVAQRQALEVKVSRLSSNSLDLDLLDERARVVLGYAGKDEAVILSPQQSATK